MKKCDFKFKPRGFSGGLRSKNHFYIFFIYQNFLKFKTHVKFHDVTKNTVKYGILFSSVGIGDGVPGTGRPWT
jgi:hypothetical protein